MSSLDFDGQDDTFLDVSDDVRSSKYSTARCSTSDQLSVSWRPEYELWMSEPMSVIERRHRFLIGLGLAQPTAGIAFQHWQGETLADCALRDLEERISSICSSYQSSISHCASAQDSTYCIRDLDTENRVVVHESEVGTDKIMNINQSEGFLSFSQLVHEFLRKGGGRTRVRGSNISVTDKQKDPKNICGRLTRKKGGNRICMYRTNMKTLKTSTFSRTKVDQQNKKWMDFSAVYMCQEIQAHGGSIRVMKFSPSGMYLASVGEDCIVRIWTIQEVESSPDLYVREAPVECMDRNKGSKMKVEKDCRRTLAIIPKLVFNIAETPLHEFRGHTSDILDMTWSKSDFLLTSSKDKTVRMWKVGSDGCLAVFKHRDYVTSVHFNPVDERYFVSGSIDGKVRVWDVSEKRVIDWADIKHIITAVSYQPDAKGLIVGTVAGRCRFYDQTGENYMEAKKELKVTKKKSARKQITSLQFSGGATSRMLIASAGSKIRVSEGTGINRKFEGRRGSKILVPPSLTSDGQYLVSAGADSNVYIWNFDKSRGKCSKGARRVRSCEHFVSEGVTSVATWPGLLDQQEGHAGDLRSPPEKGPTLCRDRECCSFGTWFVADDGGKGNATTWPEEKLLPSLKYVNCGGVDECRSKVPAAAWNTVVVTGGRDGVIRCFHNYGMPVKL
ncbi:hypothetical protein HU200_038748 [Digitaria exilis]|uniref:Uncharacterized protein n=1 Tax=Digitaria exilis TaxID=1010633 RepID=A0A835B947_9POAL|nr:hypothetical protein HU200_038748 [Digitaria exilis]